LLRSKRVPFIGAAAVVLVALVIGIIGFDNTRDAEATGPFVMNDVASTAFTLALGGPLGTRHSVCLGNATNSGSTANMRVFCYTVAKPASPPSPPPPPYQALDTAGALVPLTGTFDTSTGAYTLEVGCLPADLDADTVVGDGIFVSLTGNTTKAGLLASANVLLEIDDGEAGARQQPTPTTCSEKDQTIGPTPITYASLGIADNFDGDQCTTREELGTVASAGGLRDPFNPYDFFNPNKMGGVDVDDIFFISAPGRIFSSPPAPLYTTNADRASVAGRPGPNGWNAGPPNGVIDIDDIFSASAAFAHNC
jgi:hypothetical protein